MTTRFPTSAILLARQQFYECAGWTREASAYVKAHGLDLDVIAAHAGTFAVCLAQLSPNTEPAQFDFTPEGVPCAVIEVLDENAETVIDLVAWPLHASERLATAVGEADMLGIPCMRNPATYVGGRPLRVHRTPLGWLKAGCQGCVVLNRDWGGYWLRQAPGPLLAENLAHGRELRRMLGTGYDASRLLVPAASVARAA